MRNHLLPCLDVHMLVERDVSHVVLAGGEQLAGISFPVVVLDEGSQCAEPEALIPLTKVSNSINGWIINIMMMMMMMMMLMMLFDFITIQKCNHSAPLKSISSFANPYLITMTTKLHAAYPSALKLSPCNAAQWGLRPLFKKEKEE